MTVLWKMECVTTRIRWPLCCSSCPTEIHDLISSNGWKYPNVSKVQNWKFSAYRAEKKCSPLLPTSISTTSNEKQCFSNSSSVPSSGNGFRFGSGSMLITLGPCAGITNVCKTADVRDPARRSMLKRPSLCEKCQQLWRQVCPSSPDFTWLLTFKGCRRLLIVPEYRWWWIYQSLVEDWTVCRWWLLHVIVIKLIYLAGDQFFLCAQECVLFRHFESTSQNLVVLWINAVNLKRGLSWVLKTQIPAELIQASFLQAALFLFAFVRVYFRRWTLIQSDWLDCWVVIEHFSKFIRQRHFSIALYTGCAFNFTNIFYRVFLWRRSLQANSIFGTQ